MISSYALCHLHKPKEWLLKGIMLLHYDSRQGKVPATQLSFCAAAAQHRRLRSVHKFIKCWQGYPTAYWQVPKAPNTLVEQVSPGLVQPQLMVPIAGQPSVSPTPHLPV